MKLEDLTQELLEELVARSSQRAVFAAILAGTMELPATTPEALLIKRRMMSGIALALEMGIRVGDHIEKEVLLAMKEHCEEQIEIDELINPES